MGAAASTSYVTNAQTLARQEFDYVIVGAGPAGCVLANRLSADPNNKVLLVEAGGDNDVEIFSKIPAAWPKLLHTRADWDYYTKPQSTLEGRQLFWPRGKVLGGSTTINAMMYQHAPPDDLDEFERLGATGWSANDMAPYYKKTEKFTPSSHHVSTLEHRGDSGVWNTGYVPAHPMTTRFVEAAAKAGIPHIHEHNTPKGPNGVSHMMTFIDQKGARSSAATSYLSAEVRARKNLTIALNTLCTKVTLSPSANGELTCTGAEFAQSADGPRTSVKACKEVIICSGSIGTPQILMCSGIGPKEELTRAGIPIQLVNENVGQHMLDHLAALCVFHAKESYDWLASPVASLPALIRWLVAGGGPMSTNAGEAAAFVRLDATRHLWESKVSTLPDTVVDTTSGANAPDIEMIGVPLQFFKHGLVPAPSGCKSFSVGTALLRPLSTGYVGIKSSNVFDKALIEPNYFSNETDLHNFIRAIRMTITIAKSSPLADKLNFDYTKKNTNVSDVYWLADQDPATLTDEQIEKWLRTHTETLYHPVSTARIARTAIDGVVDSDLKVFGVSNLRIADASVFPGQIAAHTTATVIALGEKASDLVLNAKA